VGSKDDVAAYEIEGVMTISSLTGVGSRSWWRVSLNSCSRFAPRRRRTSITRSSCTSRCPTRSRYASAPNSCARERAPRAARVRFQDLTDDEALAEIVRRLRALGVDRLLARAGVLDGDVVTIGPALF